MKPTASTSIKPSAPNIIPFPLDQQKPSAPYHAHEGVGDGDIAVSLNSDNILSFSFVKRQRASEASSAIAAK